MSLAHARVVSAAGGIEGVDGLAVKRGLVLASLPREWKGKAKSSVRGWERVVK